GIGLGTGRAELARAVSEGVGHSIALALEALVSAGRGETRIVAVGGGVKNPIITRTICDVTGRDLALAQTLGASYGDAILAGIGVGTITEEEGSAWPGFLPPVTASDESDPEVATIRAA